jgi:hypothetical protein
MRNGQVGVSGLMVASLDSLTSQLYERLGGGINNKCGKSVFVLMHMVRHLVFLLKTPIAAPFERLSFIAVRFH